MCFSPIVNELEWLGLRRSSTNPFRDAFIDEVAEFRNVLVQFLLANNPSKLDLR